MFLTLMLKKQVCIVGLGQITCLKLHLSNEFEQRMFVLLNHKVAQKKGSILYTVICHIRFGKNMIFLNTKQ